MLAVYDDFPNWREIEFKYNKTETYQMGLLEFPGKHKIFAVDGQHRVEGIKAALDENPLLAEERIAALFIGHKNTDAGKQKTRRLFSTLNRYAKPVTPDDIIALDEDDSAAIMTRELLEEYSLFSGKRVIYAKQKAIPPSNKDAITSIITLYQANVEIFKDFFFTEKEEKIKKAKLVELLKFRPIDSDFEAFKSYCLSFWNSFSSMKVIQEYQSKKANFSLSFRNNDSGGNLVFRPIGFLPLVKASIFIQQNSELDYAQIFSEFSKMDLDISKKPWQYVVWDPIGKKMIMSSDSVTELLLIYLFDKTLLSARNIKNLKEGYAAKLLIEDQKLINNILDNIK